MKKKMVTATLLVVRCILPVLLTTILTTLLASKAAYAHSLSMPHIHFDSATVVLSALMAMICVASAVKLCLRGAAVVNRWR